MRMSWWGQWFGGRGSRDAKALQVLLTKICRQETALTSHLADRARAMRFTPHWLSLEGLAERESQNAVLLRAPLRRGRAAIMRHTEKEGAP